MQVILHEFGWGLSHPNQARQPRLRYIPTLRFEADATKKRESNWKFTDAGHQPSRGAGLIIVGV
jgi:hypothetical protein